MENEQEVNQDTETPEIEDQDSTPEDESIDITDTTEFSQAEEESQSGDEAGKLKEVAQNQKIRAEKAERELKALKNKPQEKETPTNTDMSLKQIEEASALLEVPKEDRTEVAKYAKNAGLKYSEAVEDSVVKTILKTRAEERKSAEATNIKKTRRTSSGNSDEALLDKLEKGELAEDDTDAAASAMINQMRGD
tara:strand:- start:5395 stop:5973 length:579 start_codon:yes stop_codon:yes gene_type:complete